MSYTEERIVKMTFDHSSFSKDIDSTIKSLKELDEALSFKNADVNYRAIDNLNSSLEETDEALSKVEQGVDKVKVAFNTLQIIGISVLSELTRSAMNFANNIYSNSLGQIISGGRQRALNLEQAKFQLEGMHVAWDDISGDIDYAVKDTAYGLDAAAKVASQLAASQISVGDNMKNALRAISGVAAMTNTSYENIGHIFTTIASNGKLMTMQLRSLSAYGLNVSANMIDYYKNVKHMKDVTEKEINDMVSKGKIAFQDFANAMDYAFGEHAKQANETFSGALSNIKAALSRVGEMFATPYFNFMRDVYNDLIPVVNFMKKAMAIFEDFYKLQLNERRIWLYQLVKCEDLYTSIANIAAAVYSWIKAAYIAAYEAGMELPNVYKILSSIKDITGALILDGERFTQVKNLIRSILLLVNVLKNGLYLLYYAFEPLITAVMSLFGIVMDSGDDISTKIEKFATLLNYINILVANLVHNGIKKALPVAAKILAKLVEIGQVVAMLIALIAYTVYSRVSNLINNIKKDGVTIESIAKNVGAEFVHLGGAIASAFEVGIKYAKQFIDFVKNGFSSFFSDFDIFSSKMDKASNSAAGKNGPGVTGGKFLKGASSKLIDTTKLIDNYADVNKKASGIISKIQNEGEPKDANVTADDTYEYITRKSSFLGLLKEINLKEAFGKIISGVINTFSNFFKAFKTANSFIAKAGIFLLAILAIKSLFGPIKELFEVGNPAKQFMDGIADILKALTGVVIAVTIFAGVMALITKNVDVAAFERTIDAVIGMVGGIAIIAVVVAMLNNLRIAAKHIKILLMMLRATITDGGDIEVALRRWYSRWAAVLNALTLFMVALMASITTIIVLKKKFGATTDDFVSAALIIGGSMAAIIGTMVLLDKIMRHGLDSTTTQSMGISLKKLSWWQNFKTTSFALELLIALLTPFMTVLSAAIIILSKQNPEHVKTSAITLIGSAIGVVAAVISLMLFASKILYGPAKALDPAAIKLTSAAINAFIREFFWLMVTVMAFVQNMALSMMMLKGMTPDQIIVAGTIIAGTTMATVLMITAMIAVMTYANSTLSDAKMMKKLTGSTTTLLVAAISAIATMMLVIASAMYIIGKINPDRLIPAGVTVLISILLVTGIVSGIMFAILGVSKMLDSMGGGVKKMIQLRNTMITMTIVISEIMTSIIAFAITFAVVAKVLDSTKDQFSAMISTTAVMLLAIASIMLIIVAMTAFNEVRIKGKNIVALIAVLMAVESFIITVGGLAVVLSSVNWQAIAGSAAIVLTSIGSILAIMLGLTALSNVKLSVKNLVEVIATMLAVEGFLFALAICMKILNTIDWSAWANGEQYILHFVAGVVIVVTIFAVLSRFMASAVAGVGVLILLLGGISTAAVILAIAANAFAGALVKLSEMKMDKASEKIDQLDHIVATFIEIMASMSARVILGAIVFAIAMALMGNGLEAMSNLDAKSMKYAVEALKVILSDMTGLSKILKVALEFGLLFALLGASLSAGIVGFVIFAALIGVVVDLIIPVLSKLAKVTEDSKKIMMGLAQVYSKEEAQKLLAGMVEMFYFGALFGIVAATLTTSALVFLVGCGILYYANKVYKEAMTGFFKIAKMLEGRMKPLTIAMVKLWAVAAMLGIVAATLLGSGVALVLATASAWAGAVMLGLFLAELNEAFYMIYMDTIVEGCFKLIAASVLIGIASLALAAAGLPFVVATSLFAVGIGTLAASVALLGVGVSGLAAGFNTLAEISDEKLSKAVDSIVKFIMDLNKALTEASEVMSVSEVTIFTSNMTAFALVLGVMALVLPLTSGVIAISSAILYGGFWLLGKAFGVMNEAFKIFKYEEVSEFLNSCSLISDQLGDFAGWFMLYSIPFAVGALAFVAGSILIYQGLSVLQNIAKKFDIKKLTDQLEPLIDSGKNFLIYCGLMAAGAALLALAGYIAGKAAVILSSAFSAIETSIIGFLRFLLESEKILNQIIANAPVLGQYIDAGIAEGLDESTAAEDAASKKGDNVFLALCRALQIFSPSLKGKWAGNMFDAGIAEGIEEGGDDVEQASEDVAEEALSPWDKFKNWMVDKLSSTGLLAGNGLGSGLYESISEWFKSTIDEAGGFMGIINKILDLPSPAEITQAVAGYQKSAAEAYAHGGKELGDYYMAQAEAQKEKYSMFSSVDSFKDWVDGIVGEFFGKNTGGFGTGGGGTYTPVYTDGTPTPEDYNKSGRGVGSSSATNNAKTAGSNVGTSIVNNNNYQFIQNNYSPEPIDRTELYNQTNRQLNTWYKFIGTQS